MSAGVSAVRTTVGYKANELRDGTTLVAPCFIDVGAEDSVDLSKFTPGGNYGSGEIEVQTLDFAGRTLSAYSYRKPRLGDWRWEDDNGEIGEGDVLFEAGEGISVTGLDGLSLTASGKVSTDDRKVVLREGTIISGNFTPVPIDLTEIVPGGEYSSGEIEIQTLDFAGRTIAAYAFRKPRIGVWRWENDDGAVAEGDVTFAPGFGFSVTGVDGANITIPGPTL